VLLHQHPMKEEGGLMVIGGGQIGGNESSTPAAGYIIKNVWVHVQAAMASTDTSSDSVVTVGLPPQPTPQQSPRATGPAGSVVKP